jgi:predicted transcriptional regulator
MTIDDVIQYLDAEVLTDSLDRELEIPCGFAADLISDILHCTVEPALLLTGITNMQIIRLADMIDLVCLIYVRGKKPPQDIIERANKRNLPILSTKYTMFKSCGILYREGLRSCKT